MKKVLVFCIALLFGCSYAFAQGNNDGEGAFNDSQASHEVTIKAYAPPPTCSGTRYVTTITAKVKWWWNDVNFMTKEATMEYNSATNGYEVSFVCAGCAPTHVEYCLEGRDNFFHNNLLVKVTSKKEVSNCCPGNDVFTILSNEWNGVCFGSYPSYLLCDQ